MSKWLRGRIAEVAQSLPNPTPEGVEWASEAERALMATTDDPEAGKRAVSGSNQRRGRYAIRIFCRYLHAMPHSRLQAGAVHSRRARRGPPAPPAAAALSLTERLWTLIPRVNFMLV